MIKYRLQNRLLCLLLTAVMLLSMLPVGVSAAGENAFVLVVEAGGTLVIKPKYVSYTEGQTVLDALTASGHTFTGIETGMVSEIDGTVGNFTRSDQDGGFALERPAAEVTHFRFSEAENSQPSAGLRALMTAMADYQTKPEDVRNAAKIHYQTACDQFVGLSGESAQVLADNLNNAILEYEESQNGDVFAVTFMDTEGAYSDTEIVAVNSAEKTWTDDGDGVLELPEGKYSFRIRKDGLSVSGSIQVAEEMTVQAALPRELWLKREEFRLSGSYGAQGSGEMQFTDDEFVLGQWDGRRVTVPVSDTFFGSVYSYAVYDTEKLSALPTLTAVYQSAQSGEQMKVDIPFKSLTSGASSALKQGAASNTIIYRLSSQQEDGFTYSQDYTVTFDRIPTLIGIKVCDQRGVDQIATEVFDANVTEYTYKVLNTTTAVTVKATPLDSSYTVLINGEDGSTPVEIPITGSAPMQIPITISANGYINSYNLTVLPGEGNALSFLTSSDDVTLEVVNSNGEVMPFEKFKEGSSGNRYQYSLIPGETYAYVATAGTYYHVADSFTMEDAADSTILVNVPTEDWLQSFALGIGGTAAKYQGSLELDTAFDPADHDYETTLADMEHLAYVWVTGNTSATITAEYNQLFSGSTYHGKPYSLELISGSKTGTQLKRFLMDENPIENTLTIRLSKELDGVTQYQDYEISFKRELTLKDLTAESDGITLTLMQSEEKTGFAPSVRAYSIAVSMEAEALTLNPQRYTGNTCYGEAEVGYTVKVDGSPVAHGDTAKIELDGTMQTQFVTVTVENPKAPGGSSTYTLTILKSPPVETTFVIQPEGALLAMYEARTGQRIWVENNTYQLCESYGYRYALTACGYVGKTGTLTVTRDENNSLVIADGENVYPVVETETGGSTEIIMSLEKAAANPAIKENMSAYWPDFRGNSANNAVVNAKIPTRAEDSTLYWANQIGKGFDSDAVGSPILVGGDLITYAGDKIYRVDTVSGQVKATGTMDHKSSFSITPPTYAEGMVFVALSDGTVQAFNAATLESLWVYRDPLGGQPNCPLTVKGGKLYTGFWVGETSDANFVCLTITDEDPTQEKETKCAAWSYTAKGGYYWAGAYAAEEFVLVGTDDGTNGCTGQSSRLLLLDADTGALLDSLDGLDGDIRSTVVYDAATNAYYFTSKGGSFYSVGVEDGARLTQKWSVKLANGGSGVPMSTSSPVVYNGRAYVGVSGAGQFSSYSGHNITVIDLPRKAIAYSVQTQGYPQTSGLLTTAYEQENGYVYIYFFDNMTPGKLRVLRDKVGQKAADYVTTEGDYRTAYALFTPTGDHAQYAICSPIVDAYGTVYFKNDAAYLVAFGSAIEKIEVTQMPRKTEYGDGEKFRPDGMVVTATYANGTTRDVTAYGSFDRETVSKDNPIITISFPYVMYHNQEDGTKMTSGIVTTTPATTLELTVGDEATVLAGDLDDNGVLELADVTCLISWFYGSLALEQEQLDVADVNRDSKVDLLDANLILSMINGTI